MAKLKEFTYRCLVYRETDDSFTGVCLDLDIVEENHQTMEQAILSLHDAVETHLKAAAGLQSPKELMYRPAPRKYWNILQLMTAAQPQKQNIPPEFRLFPMTGPTLMSHPVYA
ncbi:MAG: hypothetical protein ACD_12C00216G0002 [uncultured bacterium]|nr:MAG: hypothetical protein ACD_12C00216G0002 [uncultured bacterium]